MKASYSSVVILLMAVGLCGLGGCQPESGREEEAIKLAKILGTVNYRERIALPPNAVIHVRLEDVTIRKPAAAVIAEVIMRPDREVPIPFTLEYNADRINSQHHYEIRAEIRDVDNRLLWINRQPYGVLTYGHHPNSGVEIMMQPVETGES